MKKVKGVFNRRPPRNKTTPSKILLIKKAVKKEPRPKKNETRMKILLKKAVTKKRKKDGLLFGNFLEFDAQRDR